MLRTLLRWTPTLAIVGGIAYFASHALTGENGLVAWAETRRRVAALEAQLADAQAAHAALEIQAARLRDETLDLDYLDERARKLLGLSRPGEIVVPEGAREAAAKARPR